MLFNRMGKIFLYNQSETAKKIINLDEFNIGIFISKNEDGSENEDSLFLTKEKDIIRFGVADGAGGHPCGKDAAFLALNEIKDIKPQSILDQIEIANDKILDLKVGAKTTLAFAQVNKDKISFHTVGDSEIIYWNAIGRELFSSTPHSPTGLKVEAGVTTQEESLVDPERHIVNSFLGDDFVKINSTTNFELKKGHTVLLGTDGLFDNISHQELCEMVSLGNFEESFNKLVKFCESRDKEKWLKEDDIAFVYFRKIKT